MSTTLWHGTAAQLEPTIRQGGLEAPPNSLLCFVEEYDEAAEMAAEVVAWLLESGPLDDLRGLVVRVEIPTDQLPTLHAVPVEWITEWHHATYPPGALNG